MKILVRLPNWLGDMVMSVGFMHQLPLFFPHAEISVIAKKGIHELLTFFPLTHHQFIFNKEEYKGIGGALKFGRQISEVESFDLFFSLPNSFSSALIGFASRSKKRIGYKQELRQLLLTNAYAKPKGLHRADEYIRLLELYTGQKAQKTQVSLFHPWTKKEHMVVNINSEAASRRLPLEKAVEVLEALCTSTTREIVLIGAPKEKEFVDEVLSRVSNKSNIRNVAGSTSLVQLTEILASARVMLSTDSGPAHLANALGTYTVVLFGAGNEKNTAPYDELLRTVIRLGELSCEPCEKNICVRYGTPQCLVQLNTGKIIETVNQHI